MKMGLPDWKTELLKLGKQSLRMKVDTETCASMTSLGEFESYIHASYIAGMNLLTDLFRILAPWRSLRRGSMKPSMFTE